MTNDFVEDQNDTGLTTSRDGQICQQQNALD